MTREREIHEAYKEHLLNEGNPSNGFEYGARWADSHRWHEVADGDLPKKGVFLVCKTGGRPIFKVLEYSEKRDAFWTSSGGFLTCDGVREYFTHWMEIPELPKEE